MAAFKVYFSKVREFANQAAKADGRWGVPGWPNGRLRCGRQPDRT
jgi:hypothetical protein